MFWDSQGIFKHFKHVNFDLLNPDGYPDPYSTVHFAVERLTIGHQIIRPAVKVSTQPT